MGIRSKSATLKPLAGCYGEATNRRLNRPNKNQANADYQACPKTGKAKGYLYQMEDATTQQVTGRELQWLCCKTDADRVHLGLFY